MNNEQIKIWFAGFYEGEGSISNDINNRNRIRISISQNDITPLNIGKNIWGGSVRQRIRKSPASDKVCIGHEWTLNHNDSLRFINDIKPFMIIPYKIEQIEQIDKCMKIQNDIWERDFKCSHCDNTYTDSSGRRRHEKQVHINNNEKIKCIHCDKLYNSMDSMKRHIKLKHII